MPRTATSRTRLSNSCSAGNGIAARRRWPTSSASWFVSSSVRRGRLRGPARAEGSAMAARCSSTRSKTRDFQKEGYAKEELLAGLALVLPKNIWQYVVQIPRMSELGRVAPCCRAVTQKNSPRPRPGSTTSRSASRAPRRPAPALRRGRRDRRRVRGATRDPPPRQAFTSVGLDQAIAHRPSSRPTTSTRAATSCTEQLLAHVHRHQDSRRQDRALHLRVLVPPKKTTATST